MQIIKTYWGVKGNYMVAIHSNCYTSSLDYILTLLAILRADYPGQKINPEDVTIVIYNAKRTRGIMGIEYRTDKPNKQKYEHTDLVPCKF